MTIYKSTRVLPYVYMCKEKNSPYFYIGYRYVNYLPSTDDFGTKYFTSNDYVRENFNNFEHIIIAEFFTKEAAYEFESNLIKETRSEYQINYIKYKKMQGKKYNKIPQCELVSKLCALPECQKPHTNWRMKCCCSRHNNIHAARNRIK